MTHIPILKSELFKQHARIQFGMSTKRGGVSPEPLGMNLSFNVGDDKENVERNRELFFGALNIQLDALAIPRQVHSVTVRRTDKPGSFPECDALITDRERVFLCVSVADCVPIFLFDAKRNAIAGVHAGWRGTAGSIVCAAVKLMMNEFGTIAADLVAYVGPSASSCCYNVGEDVAARFADAFVYRQDGTTFVDLKSANVAQLRACGVRQSAIEVSSLCTISERELLHSYRRDKEKSGRMMAVIGLV